MQSLGFIPFLSFFVDKQVASFVGPILGGVFTDKATWRWCFYINLPFGIIAITGVMSFLQNPSHLTTNKSFKARLFAFDYIGPTLFIIGSTCLLLALQWGGLQYSWNSPIIVSLLCGSGIITVLWVYSQVRLGERATIPIRLILQRTVFFSALYSFFTGSAFMIPVFYLPLYFQAVKSTSATTSAVDILPLIVGLTASSIGGIFLLKMVNGYYTSCMILGASLLSVGLGLLSTLKPDTTLGHWLAYQFIAGLGSGINIQVSKSLKA